MTTRPEPRVNVRRTPDILRPDPARVIAKTFLPGQELLTGGRSRATAVIDRILGLDDDEVRLQLASTIASFGPRHRDLAATLDAHYDLVAHRLEDPASLSDDQRRLIGAYFTQEYAVEAAALLNPSMVAHPDQGGLPDGTTRFVMSVRGVGEGHISSIGFRSGTVGPGDQVAIDGTGRATVQPVLIETVYSKSAFAQQLVEMGGDQSSAKYAIAELPEAFGRIDLDAALARLSDQGLTRGSGARTIELLERIAACNYSIRFPEDSTLSERVIIPGSPSESHGMEDVRLVRFVHADDTIEYLGTYTAFDGAHVVSQLLRTTDFQTFHIAQLSGPAAKDKGMALFPRRIGGRFLAVARWDRENNGIASSTDLLHWQTAGIIQEPRNAWELVQIGNCGPPIETALGWLVLTHGVGPMREYSIGAMLLHLDDPHVVLGRLDLPLINPADLERDGYVPNVVYTCGAMSNGATLVLPYGCDDAFIRMAVVDVAELLAALTSGTHEGPDRGVTPASRAVAFTKA